jgi:3-hydroxyacyl-[acyl-carrier-protein] dehydratase
MRFYLIDRVEEICCDKYITAVKCITLGDDVFDYHFPGNPIFPGTLIIEGLAQLSGMFLELIIKRKESKQKHCIPTIVNKMKFRKPAVPGDRLWMRADIVSLRENYGVVKVKAEIDGKTCTEGELIFALVDVQDEALHKKRMELYDVYLKHAREVP